MKQIPVMKTMDISLDRTELVESFDSDSISKTKSSSISAGDSQKYCTRAAVIARRSQTHSKLWKAKNVRIRRIVGGPKNTVSLPRSMNSSLSTNSFRNIRTQDRVIFRDPANLSTASISARRQVGTVLVWNKLDCSDSAEKSTTSRDDVAFWLSLVHRCLNTPFALAPVNHFQWLWSFPRKIF